MHRPILNVLVRFVVMRKDAYNVLLQPSYVMQGLKPSLEIQVVKSKLSMLKCRMGMVGNLPFIGYSKTRTVICDIGTMAS